MLPPPCGRTSRTRRTQSASSSGGSCPRPSVLARPQSQLLGARGLMSAHRSRFRLAASVPGREPPGVCYDAAAGSDQNTETKTGAGVKKGRDAATPLTPPSPARLRHHFDDCSCRSESEALGPRALVVPGHPPQHGLSSNKMALITSECGAGGRFRSPAGTALSRARGRRAGRCTSRHRWRSAAWLSRGPGRRAARSVGARRLGHLQTDTVNLWGTLSRRRIRLNHMAEESFGWIYTLVQGHCAQSLSSVEKLTCQREDGGREGQQMAAAAMAGGAEGEHAADEAGQVVHLRARRSWPVTYIS